MKKTNVHRLARQKKDRLSDSRISLDRGEKIDAKTAAESGAY